MVGGRREPARRWAMLLVLGFLGGCYGADPSQWAQNQVLPEPSLPELPDAPSLDVLVLGDWGTGGDGQIQLARTIARSHGAEGRPPAITLTVGDNVYDDGVSSVEDPLWDQVFTS